MEKGWWFGVVIGVVVAFAIFSFGNNVTGNALFNFFRGAQPSAQVAPHQQVSPTITESIVGAITPTRVSGQRIFDYYNGRPLYKGCNVIAVNASVLLGVFGGFRRGVSGGTDVSGNDICQYYGYNSCSFVQAQGLCVDIAGTVNRINFDCSDDFSFEGNSLQKRAQVYCYQGPDVRAPGYHDDPFTMQTVTCCNF